MFSRSFELRDYSLAETLPSGQAFRWTLQGAAWHGVIGSYWISLEQTPSGFDARTLLDPGDWLWLEHYLQTNIDLHQVIATFPNDEPMQHALSACPGLRLLKQDPWECLASFILSSTKQIVQIRQIVEALCRCHGERIHSPPGSTWFSFPTPHKIASLSESDLRACKMGFRAPYLKGTAQLVASGRINLSELAQLPVDQARAALISLPGVGRKIADCVLLFAYGFQEAFPVDVWVMKALRQLYFPKRRPSPKRLLRFTQTYFGPFSGYAQQYLFHYIRTKAPLSK